VITVHSLPFLRSGRSEKRTYRGVASRTSRRPSATLGRRLDRFQRTPSSAGLPGCRVEWRWCAPAVTDHSSEGFGVADLGCVIDEFPELVDVLDLACQVGEVWLAEDGVWKPMDEIDDEELERLSRPPAESG
jgi:hypothetical protein